MPFKTLIIFAKGFEYSSGELPPATQEESKVVEKYGGEMIFTPPMEDHATVFIEDCDLLAISRNPRDQEACEEDVRRVILIDPDSIN